MINTDSKNRAIKIILDIFDLMERIGYGKLQADRIFGLCYLYNQKALRIDPWTYDSVGSISPTTLKNWRKQTRQRGQGKRGTGSFAKGTFCHGQANYLLGKYSGATAGRISWLIEEKLTVKNELPTAPETIPSRRTVQRYVRDWRRLESILPDRALQCYYSGENGYDIQPSLALFLP